MGLVKAPTKKKPKAQKDPNEHYKQSAKSSSHLVASLAEKAEERVPISHAAAASAELSQRIGGTLALVSIPHR